MKKYVFIALAICLLLLAGCGTLQGTGTNGPTLAPSSPSSIATLSPQDVCHTLLKQQAQLKQVVVQVNARLSAALAKGDQNAVLQEAKTLMRLHQLIAQGQKDLHGCGISG